LHTPVVGNKLFNAEEILLNEHFITGRKAGIRVIFVGLFWFVAQKGRLYAPIIVKFGRKEVARNILLTAKVKNLGVIWGISAPKKTKNCVIT